MTEYTEKFIQRIIEDYKAVIPKEYRKFTYLDKSHIEQFEEALEHTKYEDKVKILDELFNEALEDGKYNW